MTESPFPVLDCEIPPRFVDWTCHRCGTFHTIEPIRLDGTGHLICQECGQEALCRC